MKGEIYSKLGKFYTAFLSKAKVLVNKPLVIYCRDFFLSVFLYGFLLNILTFSFLKQKLSLLSIISLGIAFYFIKEEIPKIFKNFK